MNISELSRQLCELSEDYSSQRIILDEYRLKRKYLLDEIDQLLNNQNYEDSPQSIERTEKSDDMDNVLPETINKIFDFDKKGDDIEP